MSDLKKELISLPFVMTKISGYVKYAYLVMDTRDMLCKTANVVISLVYIAVLNNLFNWKFHKSCYHTLFAIIMLTNCDSIWN